MTKAFTNQPLQTIAVNCPADLLLGDGQAKPRRLLPGLNGENREIGVCDPLRAREYPLEFRRSQQARRARESIVRNEPEPI